MVDWLKELTIWLFFSQLLHPWAEQQARTKIKSAAAIPAAIVEEVTS